MYNFPCVCHPASRFLLRLKQNETHGKKQTVIRSGDNVMINQRNTKGSDGDMDLCVTIAMDNTGQIEVTITKIENRKKHFIVRELVR